MIFLRRAAVLGALLAALATPVLAADHPGFLAEVDDLPLAPGLVEQPGGTLFDSPQGRIVEANATGAVLEVEARMFYDETLPQLGWRQVGSDTYQRDKEVLRIDYSEGSPMTVHFSVAPAQAAGSKTDKGATPDQPDNQPGSGGKDDQGDQGAQ